MKLFVGSIIAILVVFCFCFHIRAIRVVTFLLYNLLASLAINFYASLHVGIDGSLYMFFH